MNKSMFDNTRLDSLDKDIAEHMTRPTLVTKLKGQKKRKKAAEMSWSAELQEYWYIYLILAVSSIFTGMLGFILGTAPEPHPDGIYFHTDGLHIIIAFVYMLTFITITEGAFALAKRRYFVREERNEVQKWTMLTAMFVAGISIVGTGIAGGSVISSVLGFLTEFQQIPANAQKWIVFIIPVLLAFYAFLFTAYHLSSDAAASERITREQIRERDLDHRTRQRAIEQIAQERLQETELQLFMKMVEEGRISAATAQAAIRAGKTLGQLEREQKRDIDGDGKIGHASPNGHRPPVRVMGADEQDFTNPPQ